MDGSAVGHESSGEIGDSVSYVSKEKYTALANEIRKWEDDLWHTKNQKSRSRVSGGSELTPDGVSKRCCIRESLSSVMPAHVSSLRKFWEGLMTKETLDAVPERYPLRQIQLSTSLEKSRNFTDSGVSTCGGKFQTKTADVEDPELPPPPVGAEEPLAPASDIPVELPPPPQLSDVEDVHSKSADFIDPSGSPRREYFVPACPSTTQPVVSKHHYYNRPRLGAYAKCSGGGFSRGVLRNWPNCSNLNESPQAESAKAKLPRQRSVTFEPRPGSAPGDSEEEGEEEVPSVRWNVSSVTSPFQGHNSDLCDAGERYKYVDGESLGLLESAARLANSADRLDRNSRSGRSSLAATGKSTASVPNTDEISSTSGGSNGCVSCSDTEDSDGESVQSEPTSNRPSLSGAGTLVSPSSSRGRKSCDAQRRISRKASALLDFDCPPTPMSKGGRPSRSNSEIAAAEAVTLRRLERMRDIADLITHEKSLIMELSSELAELHSSARAATTGKSTKCTSASGTPVLASEASVVDLNLRFLLACQRRQALLEELGLLHKGSPVLVPPMRGQPLRARLRLHAVRVALKPPACDMGGGSGYVVVGIGDRLRTVEGGRPVKYHILGVLKCVGEGRIYHTQTVTLMRVADLPPGTVRGAHFVDLVADIDIVPLRPDFVINIEVYCLQTGGNGGIGGAGGCASTGRYQSSALQTPVSRKANASVIEKSPILSSAKKCGGFNMSSLLLSGRKRKYYVSQPKEETDQSAAFTLLSSVSLRHHDDLLFGKLPRARRGVVGGGDANMAGSSYALEEAEGGGKGDEATEMPLYLEGLPRSSPLAGPLGLIDIMVRLQSAVLKRGFLTVFDESGGMGVWTRCWCKLSVDQLVYWRYPEDEIEAAVAWPASSTAASAAAGPVGRLDLRRVVAPWAVQAPRKICARANTLYMRSLVAVNAKMVLRDTAQCGDGVHGSAQGCATATSILLHASPDYKWMEQRHLICADSEAEMESWVKELNGALEVLQRWMPEHFARLARYDSGLTFTQPVAASVASRLKQW